MTWLSSFRVEGKYVCVHVCVCVCVLCTPPCVIPGGRKEGKERGREGGREGGRGTYTCTVYWANYKCLTSDICQVSIQFC